MNALHVSDWVVAGILAMILGSCGANGAYGASGAKVSKEDFRKTMEHIQELARSQEAKLAEVKADRESLLRQLKEEVEEGEGAKAELEIVNKAAVALRADRDRETALARKACAERDSLRAQCVELSARLNWLCIGLAAVVAAWLFAMVLPMARMLPAPYGLYARATAAGLSVAGGVVVFGFLRYFL